MFANHPFSSVADYRIILNELVGIYTYGIDRQNKERRNEDAIFHLCCKIRIRQLLFGRKTGKKIYFATICEGVFEKLISAIVFKDFSPIKKEENWQIRNRVTKWSK